MAAVTAPAAAAALSLLVAWVHLAYAASHLRQWWAYGAFFIAAGVGQALFAPLILRRPRPTAACAISHPRGRPAVPRPPTGRRSRQGPAQSHGRGAEPNPDRAARR